MVPHTQFDLSTPPERDDRERSGENHGPRGGSGASEGGSNWYGIDAAASPTGSVVGSGEVASGHVHELPSSGQPALPKSRKPMEVVARSKELLPWFGSAAEPSYQPNVKLGPTILEPATRSKLNVYSAGPRNLLGGADSGNGPSTWSRRIPDDGRNLMSRDIRRRAAGVERPGRTFPTTPTEPSYA